MLALVKLGMTELQSCSGDQASATATTKTAHGATDISNSFFGHLDRNVPAVLIITMVSTWSNSCYFNIFCISDSPRSKLMNNA